eukprot:EG_transcript_20440
MSTAARTRRDEVWEQKRNAYLQRQRMGGAQAQGYAPVAPQPYPQPQQTGPRPSDVFGEAIAPTFDPARPQPRRATPQGAGESPGSGSAGPWHTGPPAPPGPNYPAYPSAPAPGPYAQPPPQYQSYPQQGGYPYPQQAAGYPMGNGHPPAMPAQPQQYQPHASQPQWPTAQPTSGAPAPSGGGFLDGLGQKAPAGRPRNSNFQQNQGNLNSRPW